MSEPFLSVAQCHCTNCKKISGGTGTVNGRVPREAIRVLAGDQLLRTFQPTEGTAKTFCSGCGSNLFGGGWPASKQASVRLSAIDSPVEDKPESHIFVRSAAPWETLPDDGIPRYEVRPSS
ncbi:MAG: GFA family protein [Actinobacteria bacterium]|nr:GFA family protein [Actinomycetota bacterium]